MTTVVGGCGVLALSTIVYGTIADGAAILRASHALRISPTIALRAE